MKRVLISMIVVLALSLGIALASSLIMRHVALEIEDMRTDVIALVENNDADGAAVRVTQMADMWKKHEPMLEMIAPHETLHDVTCLIVEADANLSARDLDDFNRSMKLLGIAIEHLFIEEQFRLENIF